MAFVASLAGKQDYVPIMLNGSFTARMSLLTEHLFSDVGHRVWNKKEVRHPS